MKKLTTLLMLLAVGAFALGCDTATDEPTTNPPAGQDPGTTPPAGEPGTTPPAGEPGSETPESRRRDLSKSDRRRIPFAPNGIRFFAPAVESARPLSKCG